MTETLEEKKQSLSYPRGIDQVPYASFMKIERYEYQEGLAKVAANQNDALGSFARSGTMKTLVNGVTGAMSGVYGGAGTGGDADARMNTIADDIARDGVSTTRKKWDFLGWAGTGRPKTEVPGGDNEITLPSGEKTTWNKLKAGKDELMERRRKGLQASELNVALPEEFQYKYSADWGNEFKMGTMALMADNAAKFAALGLAGAGAGALITNTLGRLKSASGVVGKIPGMPGPDEYAASMAKGAGMATNPFNVNSEMSMKNIVGLGGMAPNENAIQMFTKMNMRSFSLSFTFAARNAGESEDIQTIIEWFKRGMHPGSKNGKGSAVVLTFPDVFVLTPKFVECDEQGTPQGDPVQHPMMPRTKLCALTGLSINTTPFGQMQTVFDGTIPIVTMELNFKETTKLTRVDMEGATFKGKANPLQTNSGVFTRDTSLDNTPEISF